MDTVTQSSSLVSITAPKAYGEILNLENDFVYSMGSNSHGQLGISEPCLSKQSPVLIEGLAQQSKVNWIACGGNRSFAVTETGDVYGWGQGSQGALGHAEVRDCSRPTKIPFQSDIRIVQVASGHAHTAFVDRRGCVMVCGENESG